MWVHCRELGLKGKDDLVRFERPDWNRYERGGWGPDREASPIWKRDKAEKDISSRSYQYLSLHRNKKKKKGIRVNFDL